MSIGKPVVFEVAEEITIDSKAVTMWRQYGGTYDSLNGMGIMQFTASSGVLNELVAVYYIHRHRQFLTFTPSWKITYDMDKKETRICP